MRSYVKRMRGYELVCEAGCYIPRPYELWYSHAVDRLKEHTASAEHKASLRHKRERQNRKVNRD